MEETIEQRNNRFIAMQWMIKGAMIVLGCTKEEAKKKLDEAAMRDKE